MDEKKISELLVSADITIKEAMERLNRTAQRILFVASGRKITGAVTDGDIRRGLIHDLKFKDRVAKVMSRRFVSLSVGEPRLAEKARNLMRDKEIEQIPVLDKKGRIADVLLWTDVFGRLKAGKAKRSFSNQVIIMAGGKGERLNPFTKILPKPLIPIGEKPVIELIMEKFSRSGFTNFIFTLNYRKEYLKMFLKENKFPFKIDWVEEDDFLGTAGSLSLVKGMVRDTFFVTNCDIILDADYGDILKWHRDNSNLMTVIGCHKEMKIPYGVLKVDNGILNAFIEKPNHDLLVNTGVYILEPEVIRLIPRKTAIDMDALIDLAKKTGKVSVYPIHEGWFDIGQWDEYQDSIKKFNDIIKPEIDL